MKKNTAISNLIKKYVAEARLLNENVEDVDEDLVNACLSNLANSPDLKSKISQIHKKIVLEVVKYIAAGSRTTTLGDICAPAMSESNVALLVDALLDASEIMPEIHPATYEFMRSAFDHMITGFVKEFPYEFAMQLSYQTVVAVAGDRSKILQYIKFYDGEDLLTPETLGGHGAHDRVDLLIPADKEERMFLLKQISTILLNYMNDRLYDWLACSRGHEFRGFDSALDLHVLTDGMCGDPEFNPF